MTRIFKKFVLSYFNLYISVIGIALLGCLYVGYTSLGKITNNLEGLQDQYPSINLIVWGGLFVFFLIAALWFGYQIRKNKHVESGQNVHRA
jgi:uncharacterized BrkB/YihY/UPF0761 family membrane protein